MNKVDWKIARSEVLLDSGTCNLNCGSFGPTPQVVWNECQRLRYELASQPMNFFLRTTPQLLPNARASISKHINANHLDLVFCSNVTNAINMVASSWKLNSNDIILTTDLEYGAMRWVWDRVAQKFGCSVQVLEMPHLSENPKEIIAVFEPYLRLPVKILFFSHVTSPTGMVLPALDLCRMANNRGIATVVDGAHAVGTLDLSLRDINADCYGSNLHKWLGAPTGSAFLAVKPEVAESLDPLIVSWGYHKPPGLPPNEPDEWGSTPNIRRLEFVGTIDPCPWLVTPIAVDFQNRLGLQNIIARQRELVLYARERLACFSWLVPATPVSMETSCAMVAFQVGLPIQLDTLRRFLWEKHKLEIGLNQHDRLGLLLRVSCHYFTRESEIDHLVDALASLEQWMKKCHTPQQSTET